jgi:hypothetical protein
MKRKPIFHANRLDHDGRVAGKFYLKSTEQVQAVREAMKLALDHSLELWKGTSFIVHIDPRQGPAVPISRLRARATRRAA